MNRFMRCLVMWLLVLALPVQGFAASTMLLCGAGHHVAAQGAERMHDRASGSVRKAGRVVEASEPHRHLHAAQAAPTHDRAGNQSLSAKHAKVTGKCSACASCCSAVALPTTVIAFTAAAPSRALPVVELTTRVGFFTDGPDRPPRLPLA